MENQVPQSEQQEKKSGRISLTATMAKWAAVFPVLASFLVFLSEKQFFGHSPVWEILRGTGEGG